STMMDLTKLKPPQITFYCSAFSVLITLHLTIQLVSQHLFHWKNPKEQKAILVIVLMAPIYALVSFVGWLDVKGSETFFLFLESIKECYEALVRSTMMDLTKLKPPQITFYCSAFSVLITLHLTIQLVSQHLFHWKNPKEQKAILVIVLMAPIYALVSFVGWLDVKGSETFFLFLESIKECYEALVIAKYSYLNISISKNIVPDGIKGREISPFFPNDSLPASCSPSGSPHSQTLEVLDMAIRGHPTSVLYLDDCFTNHRVLSVLVELDIHYRSQCLGTNRSKIRYHDGGGGDGDYGDEKMQKKRKKLPTETVTWRH
ncbi:hypothetical protein F2Q68_00006308, partial [Brassica cretica]